jgi:hypothetical protein
LKDLSQDYANFIIILENSDLCLEFKSILEKEVDLVGKRRIEVIVEF